MKNKKLTYILLFSTAVVWGTIVFQIIKHLKKTDNAVEIKAELFISDKNLYESDTVVALKLDYPDPFLKGRGSAGNIAHGKTEPGIGRRIIPLENSVVWPEIKFTGLIMNNKTNEKLGLIQINSESFLFRKGQEIYGIKLIELSADSIRVMYKTLPKYIKKTI